jgi:arabinose-5-phosphate isomerase
MEMTAKGLGTTAVVDGDNRVAGIYTDGDLRRTLDGGLDIHNVRVDDVMTADCRTITADALAAEALHMMEEYKINALPVVDADHILTGMLNMHDLLRARVV